MSRVDAATGRSKISDVYNDVTGTPYSGNKKFGLDVYSLFSKQIRDTLRARANVVEVVRTDITSSSGKKIEMPNDADDVEIYHVTTGETVWFGRLSNVTSSTGAPMEAGKQNSLRRNFTKNNETELFGIASTGTITVFAVGVYRE